MAVTTTLTGVNQHTGAVSVAATRSDASTYARTNALDEQPLWFALNGNDGDTFSTGINNITRVATVGLYGQAYFASAADQAVGKITFAAPSGIACSVVIWRS